MEISPASKGDNAGSLWEMFIQQNVWINFLQLLAEISPQIISLPLCDIWVWVTGGSEECLIFIKFTKYCYFHQLCGPICPTLPPPLARLWKMVLPDILCYYLFTDMLEKFERYIPKPHIQTVIKIPISAIQAYSGLSNYSLKTRKQFVKRILVPETGRKCSDNFFYFKQQLLRSGQAQRAEIGVIRTIQK